MAEVTLTFDNRIEANNFISQMDHAAEKVSWQMHSTDTTKVIVNITGAEEAGEKEDWE